MGDEEAQSTWWSQWHCEASPKT